MIGRPAFLGHWDVVKDEKVVMRLELEGENWKGFLTRRAGVRISPKLAASYSGTWQLYKSDEGREIIELHIHKYDKGDLVRYASIATFFVPGSIFVGRAAQAAAGAMKVVKGIKYTVAAVKGAMGVRSIIQDRKMREGMSWRFAVAGVLPDGTITLTDLGTEQRQTWRRISF